MATPANVNCLADKRCPNCGNSDMLLVRGSATFEVTDDGVDFPRHNADIEYGDTAHTECPDCSYAGTWASFDTDPEA